MQAHKQQNELILLVGLPGVATEKRLPYCKEIAALNPDDVTAIHGLEPREENWPCYLGRRDGILSSLSITDTVTLHGLLWACICGTEYNAGDAAVSQESWVSLHPSRLVAVA